MLIFGIKDVYKMYKSSQVDDNVRFFRSYTSVSKDNIYEYISFKDVEKIISKDKGVLVIGETTDPWMQVLVNPLELYAKKYVDKIYYLELDGANTDDKNYQNLKAKLTKISSPQIIIFNKGKIFENLSKNDFIDEKFEGAPIEYFDEGHTRNLEDKLKNISKIN